MFPAVRPYRRPITAATCRCLGSAAKGVPVLGGAVQGITDYAAEPDLTTPQRVGRIVVAAAGAAVITVGVAVSLPEDAGAGLIIAANPWPRQESTSSRPGLHTLLAEQHA